jgi:hypothetical protein
MLGEPVDEVEPPVRAERSVDPAGHAVVVKRAEHRRTDAVEHLDLGAADEQRLVAQPRDQRGVVRRVAPRHVCEMQAARQC